MMIVKVIYTAAHKLLYQPSTQHNPHEVCINLPQKIHLYTCLAMVHKQYKNVQPPIRYQMLSTIPKKMTS